jgi:hypothetical protein
MSLSFCHCKRCTDVLNRTLSKDNENHLVAPSSLSRLQAPKGMCDEYVLNRVTTRAQLVERESNAKAIQGNRIAN